MRNQPQYIVIDRQDLSVAFKESRQEGAFNIPTDIDPAFRDMSPLEGRIYGILDRARYAEDRRKRKADSSPKRRKVAYLLAEPEPWMIALAFIMWEGVVQGLTWDLVKHSVQSALISLRERRLAPPAKREKQTESANRQVKRKVRTELGFRWSAYAEDGRKLYQMFIGLRRIYNVQSDRERKAVSYSVIHDRTGSGRRRRSCRE